MTLTTRKKIVILIVAILSIIAVAALITASFILWSPYTISSVGSVIPFGCEIYWHENGTDPVQQINWGTVAPGSHTNVTVYIKNIKTFNITLTLNTTRWDPPNATDFISLSWNYSGIPLVPNNISPVQLTLNVAWGIHDIIHFSFDIIITAHES